MVKICVTFDILRFLSELRFNVSRISRIPQIYFHRLRLNLNFMLMTSCKDNYILRE